MKPFYPDGPRPDRGMTGEEKARRARSFRRKAALADVSLVLTVAAALLLAYFYSASVNVPLGLFFALAAVFLLFLLGMLVGEALAFRRCPFCGRRFGGLNWKARPFLWRFLRCPDCGFEPDWDRKHRD